MMFTCLNGLFPCHTNILSDIYVYNTVLKKRNFPPRNRARIFPRGLAPAFTQPRQSPIFSVFAQKPYMRLVHFVNWGVGSQNGAKKIWSKPTGKMFLTCFGVESFFFFEHCSLNKKLYSLWCGLGAFWSCFSTGW